MRQAHRAMAWLVILFAAASAHAADDPEIAVEASASELFIGESVDYVVEVRNAQKPAPPDLSSFRTDFDVVASGDESHNQSSTFIFNGRVTQQTSFGHSYRFRLTPRRTGRLTIPAPTATIDGKTVAGRALGLNVIAPEPQDLVVPEIKADRDKLYPTQPFEVALRVLVRPLPDESDRDPVVPLRRRPPHLDVNWVEPPAGLSADDKKTWLEKLLSENDTGFTLNEVTTRSGSFFEGPRLAVFSLYQGRETRPGLDGKPVNYFVYELRRRLTAVRSGTFKLGPAIVKGSFVDGMEGSTYTARRLVAVAPAVSLEVRQVPSPRPATFCGGIGSYRLAASASPGTLRVGDPLTLTLEIQRGPGSGSLDLISAPDLAVNPQIAADFEILDKSPTGRKVGESKRFDYALRPKRPGVGVPPVAVTVFNPENEKFSDITSQPIALAVTPATHVEAQDLVGAVTSSGTPEIKSREQGIFQNVTDPSELRDQRVNVVALAALAAAAWCGVAGLIGALSVQRRKSADLVWQRKRHGKRVAERKLADARALVDSGQSTDALRTVRSALLGLVADMRNVVAEGLTASEADATLARTAVAGADRAAVARLLDAIDSAEYGSGAASDAPAMIATAAELIPRLARYLERAA
jgi:hypothetical protein